MCSVANGPLPRCDVACAPRELTTPAHPACRPACHLAVNTYGMGGMFLVSCLPIILHPVVVFGLVGGMSDATILSIVMAGRTVKCAPTQAHAAP